MTVGSAQPEILFYDGHCGLCQGAVKFVLKHERTEDRFRFAPLQGSTFRERIPAAQRAALPDSMVVLTRDGSLLIRSAAALHILRRLGGPWKTISGILSVIPAPLRDTVYNLVAAIRYRIFGRRDEVCPVASPALRARFDP